MWDVAAGDFTEILHVRKDDIHGTFRYDFCGVVCISLTTLKPWNGLF